MTIDSFVPSVYLVCYIGILMTLAFIIGCWVGSFLRWLFTDVQAQNLETATASAGDFKGDRPASSKPAAYSDAVREQNAHKELADLEVRTRDTSGPADAARVSAVTGATAVADARETSDTTKTSETTRTSKATNAALETNQSSVTASSSDQREVPSARDREELDREELAGRDKTTESRQETPPASNSASQTDTVNQTDSASQTEKAQNAKDNQAAKPAELKSAPDGGQADDLEQISGIGPVIKNLLNELGIYHFHQIADWTDENVAWVDNYLRFKGRILREKWIEQAKELSK